MNTPDQAQVTPLWTVERVRETVDVCATDMYDKKSVVILMMYMRDEYEAERATLHSQLAAAQSEIDALRGELARVLERANHWSDKYWDAIGTEGQTGDGDVD